MALELQGHTVVEAEDGKVAAKRIEGEEFDLLITDIFMPERDGLETLMNLRRDNKKLPVIAISGMPKGLELYLRAAKNLGASAILAKPFPLEELKNTVNQVLAKSNT